ncbi:MAG: aspartate carbamoyltransferase, partial [Actinomycetota bacterium]
AGDGKGEHPTQCLLDIFSLQQEFGGLEGLKVAIVGDILHSRVARSNITGFQKMGMKVTLVAPPALRPRGVEALGAEVTHSLDALEGVDVVYLLRMQKERHEGASFMPSLREYISRYCVGLRHLGKGQKVLHPGPINRGVEIEAELADSQENLILQQVEAGLAVRMSILYRIIVDSAAAAEEAAGEEPLAPETKNIRAVG